MRKLYRAAALIAVSFEISWAISASALGDAELTATVNKAKIVHGQVRVQKSGATAIFSVYKSPAAIPKDCKIDAVLIARAIMNADPQVLIVQGAYYLPGDPAYLVGTIEVHASDVKSFARGGVSARDLLNSLQFTESKPQQTHIGDDYGSMKDYPVKDGYQYSVRLRIKSQILELKGNNCDVRSYWHDFLALESNLDGMPERELNAKLQNMTTQLSVLQAKTALSSQPSDGRLMPRPGLSINRRARIVYQINIRADRREDVRGLQAHYLDAEKYARIGQQAQLDVALDRLEDDLGIAHYSGQ